MSQRMNIVTCLQRTPGRFLLSKKKKESEKVSVVQILRQFRHLRWKPSKNVMALESRTQSSKHNFCWKQLNETKDSSSKSSYIWLSWSSMSYRETSIWVLSALPNNELRPYFRVRYTYTIFHIATSLYEMTFTRRAWKVFKRWNSVASQKRVSIAYCTDYKKERASLPLWQLLQS